MILTQAQRAAVEHRCGDALVSASAGSGKTAVLARRCISLLLDPRSPCSVERMLIVTFTRAAAAELRLRIADELCAAAARTDDSPLRRHALQQRAFLGAADIGTIDAWCGRIVRENYDRIGADPTFTVIPPEEAELLREQTLDELFEWVYTDSAPEAEQARAWIRRAARPSDEFLRQMIGIVGEGRGQLLNPTAWLAEQERRLSRPASELRAEGAAGLAQLLAEDLDLHLDCAREIAASLRDAHVLAAVNAYAERLAEWAARIRQPAELPAVAREFAALKFGRIPGSADRDEHAVFEELKQRFRSELKDKWTADDIDAGIGGAEPAAELARLVLTLERRWHERLTEHKRRQGRYEFGDVLAMALDILGTPVGLSARTPTDVARALQKRYDHVLVDECQDTSPVQVELIRLVGREPPLGNRFLVGDVKQSIYGFRRAEPRLFAALAESFRSGDAAGKLIPLSDNFRTHGRVLYVLNDLFAALFEPRLGGTVFGPAERLQARRAEIPNPTLDGAPRVELHLVYAPDARPSPRADADAAADEPSAGEAPLERMHRESIVIAGEIRRLLEERVEVPRKSPDGSLELAPLRPGDIAVLLRAAAKNADTLARSLRAQGIPCVAEGRESVLDSPEVWDARVILSLLANRRQEIPLAAYLRGPVVGLSADDLLDIRRAQPHGDLLEALSAYAAAPTDGRIAEALQRGTDRLDAWARWAREQDAAAVVRRILHEGGLLSFAAGLHRGADRVARLRTLQRMAESFAESSGGGAAEFAAHLDQLQQRELESAAAAPALRDAVRVMTIHASKGLEFPVVFVANLGARFRYSSPIAVCDESAGVGVSFLDFAARRRLCSAALRAGLRNQRQRERDEELRLLYVAATRAREKLYLVGHAPPNAWNDARRRRGEGSRAPLLTRLTASSALDWVLTALGARPGCAERGDGELRVQTHALPARSSEFFRPAAADEPPRSSPLDEQDARWLEAALGRLRARPDTSLAARPAVVSVSEARSRAADGESTGAPLLAPPPPRLTPPRFADDHPAQRDAARSTGEAVHRFLELGDLRRIRTAEEVRAQAAELFASGRLSAEQQRLVPAEDVAWLGAGPLGERLAENADRCRREAAFVYGFPVGGSGDRVLLRGIVDCVIELPDGLTLIDYKTDRPAACDHAGDRLPMYERQLQLYAAALSAILAQPVRQALLVFISQRRVFEVDVSDAALRAAQEV
ncbi:MAG: UvrD-helicase domain-containing protein [Phycisphaerae bacterium]|jgi:ATP-dependent helicase/nuclease subunit A